MTPDRQEYEFGGSTEHRMERLIFYATRHGQLLSQIGEGMTDLRTRVQRLEDDRHARQLEEVRAEEQGKALLERMSGLEKSVDGLKGVLNKAIAVIATGMALAVLNWILGGGLKVTGAALRATGVAP